MATAIMARRLVLLSALLASVAAVAIGGIDPPTNDQCTTATAVPSLPYTTSGSLAGATIDAFSVTCLLHREPKDDFFVYQFNNTVGVWYKIQDVANGTELMAEVQGTGSEARGDVVMTTTSGQNACPDPFQCVKGMMMASSISADDPVPTISFHWTARAGEVYYVYVHSPNNSTPGYDLSVRQVAEGSPASQFYLRSKS